MINPSSMRVKTGKDRREKLLFPPSLEEMIKEDNIVRLIDAFVDSLDLGSLGFIIKYKEKHEPGAPQYRPSDLLKIYLYGYINRTRSSRLLERACQINIEMMWLINSLRPGHVTIANFRKDNPKGIKVVFRQYNKFLLTQDLFGKETTAIDSSKFGGQNSRKNNYNEQCIERHQKYIDKKTENYLELLDQCDQAENQELSTDQIKEKLEILKERKDKYNKLEKALEQAKEEGDKQISTIDTDARLLTSSGKKSVVGYNLQISVDDKNCLIATNELTNTTDQNALHKMAYSTMEILEIDAIDALADTGYDTGEELKKCAEDNITTFVAPRNNVGSIKEKAFRKDKFIYDKDTDTYKCPTGEILKTNSKWYVKKCKGRKDTKRKKYTLEFSKCNLCQFGVKCAGKRLNQKKGRVIERYEFAEYREDNQERVKNNKDYYRRRQAIVEHPFGTIKRQWGYTYTLLKGKEKVGAEFDLICLAYNMRRSVSILGVKELIKQLKAAFNHFFAFFQYHSLPDCYHKLKYFLPFTKCREDHRKTQFFSLDY